MTKKIRLLHIAFNDLGHGGIQSQIMEVTRRLSDKVDTDLIVWSSKPAYCDSDFEKYGRIIRCPRYEGNSVLRKKLDFITRYFSIKKAVLKTIREYGPYDAVHCHKFFECAPCLSAAYKANIPVRIAHSHNTEKPVKRKKLSYYIKNLYYGICRHYIRKYATQMIGCSQQAADYLFGDGYGKAVYNGIDIEKFNMDNYPSIPHQGIRLVHVGKFCEQKNQLFLVDIVKELVDSGVNVNLIMIGQGEYYYDKVKNKIGNFNLNHVIHILPHNSNIPLELSKSDAFIFPSTFEGFGNVLIEAQAMGLSCFVSTVVTPEADCGLLTYIPLEVGAKEWANTIKDYIDHKGLEKKRVDISKFNPQMTADNMYSLYKGNTI